MRVLFIAPLFPTTQDPSKSPDIHALAKNMMQKGHNVHVITLREHALFSQTETFRGVDVHEIPATDFLQIQYPIPNVLALARLIKKIGGGFDIHHYFQQEFLTILPSFLFKGSHKVLTVDNFPGVDWSYGKVAIDAFARLESKSLGRASLKQFDGIIFLSKLSMKTAFQLERDVKRAVWIPDGVDTNRIRPNLEVREKVREELGIGGFTLTFVGRLVPVKGIIYLAEAIEKLDAKGFGGHFIVVGDGPERRRLETIRPSRLNLHLVGFKRNPIKYVQAGDAMVLTSLGEGCPNVVLEAFACGKPAIATRVGGVPDLIQEGEKENGVIINPADVDGLVDAILSLASDERRVKLMGKRAREFAEQELEWRVVTDRTLRFYSTLL